MIKSIKFNKTYSVEPWGNTTNPLAKSKEYDNPRWSRRSGENIPRKITHVHIPLFKKGLKIEFNEGLNIIVGENGTGKTQLFKLINDMIDPNKTHRYETDGIILDVSKNGSLVKMDPENDAPKNFNPNPNDTNFLSDSLMYMQSSEQSLGENAQFILNMLDKINSSCILLDEPESGLSLKNQIKYRKIIKEISKSKQIILITHSLLFMELCNDIYDFDKHSWVASERYINNIMQTF